MGRQDGPKLRLRKVGLGSVLGRTMPALLVISLLWGLAGQSAPKRYDPDPQACQVEAIRRTYQANQLPWKDQPEVVQQRLRQLQAAMTLDTLRDCQAKGLMRPEQVRSLTVELGLPPGPGHSPPGSAAPPQSPVRP
jgi:hypothetical protein